MSDINDNLDESIPVVKIIDSGFSQSSLLLNLSHDELNKKFEDFFELYYKDHTRFNYVKVAAYLGATKQTVVKSKDVLFVKDGKNFSIKVTAQTRTKQLQSVEFSSGSNLLELLFIKFANAIEITTPKTWNNISFYFHDIVEDHRENLIPECRRKYGIEWLANYITIWRLLLFFGYFVFRLVKQIITLRRSSI